jgi:hypothetical protein
MRFMRYIKSTVYATAVNDTTELQQRAEEGCELIRNTAGTFE